VHSFQENQAPKLLDSLVRNKSVDGHDYRSDFNRILEQGFNWVITDTPDYWAAQLEKEGKRNVSRFLADGKVVRNGSDMGWYKRHVREF
jgi:hypothetical protein